MHFIYIYFQKYDLSCPIMLPNINIIKMYTDKIVYHKLYIPLYILHNKKKIRQ